VGLGVGVADGVGSGSDSRRPGSASGNSEVQASAIVTGVFVTVGE
jgi:hypothetical protein